MIRLFRSLIGLVMLAGLVWCSFRVPLGRHTFAEHVDRIGQTEEAKELLDSTRHSLSPVFRDATDRMLGEYIEAGTAPTGSGSAAPAPARAPAPESTLARSVCSARGGRVDERCGDITRRSALPRADRERRVPR